jgi:hypothetical protein
MAALLFASVSRHYRPLRRATAPLPHVEKVGSLDLGRYNCYGARLNHGTERCISVSGLSIDAAIAREVLRVLKPLGIEAAVKAIEAQSSQTTAAERQLELSL